MESNSTDLIEATITKLIAELDSTPSPSKQEEILADIARLRNSLNPKSPAEPFQLGLLRATA